MDGCNCSVKSPFMKEWTAQADLPKEVSTFERMNGRPQLLFSNKMTRYFIEWMTLSDLLKNIYISVTKTFMVQVDPLNISYS